MKWADFDLSLNSKRLSRYDATKLTRALFREFDNILEPPTEQKRFTFIRYLLDILTKVSPKTITQGSCPKPLSNSIYIDFLNRLSIESSFSWILESMDVSTFSLTSHSNSETVGWVAFLQEVTGCVSDSEKYRLWPWMCQLSRRCLHYGWLIWFM